MTKVKSASVGWGPEWGWMRRVGEAGDTQLPSEQISVPGVCSLGWNSWIYRSIIEKHLIHDCLISGYLLIFAVTKIVFYVTPSYCLSFTYCSSYCLSLCCGKCIFNSLLQQTGVNLQKLHYISLSIYSIVKYIYSNIYILFISSSFKPGCFGLLAQLNISEIYPGNTSKEIPLA